METIRIAVPSRHPGGLDSELGRHFGHCELYTIVQSTDGNIVSVQTLVNPPHEQGGCLASVKLLADQGVQILIAGGIGRRPLTGFIDAGIRVFNGGEAALVGEAVLDYFRGKLPAFSLEDTCAGGAHAHG
ncbi:MAG: NifB/NifX family molybdenum-iron cluster-binding protein [Spirochaetes bacterium]|nr:NifB/NifX family molybdenum-iron cluster-binding protein [Spirochaetota bacterium]